MPAPFVSEREAVATLAIGVFFRIEVLVDDNPGFIKEHRTENVGAVARVDQPRDAKHPVQVVKVDGEFQILLDDVFNRDGQREPAAAGMFQFIQQRRRMEFDV